MSGRRCDDIIIRYNVFKDMKETSICVSANYSWDNDGEIAINYNSFLSSNKTTIEMKNNYSRNLDCSNNFWNTTDEAKIQKMIYDKNDDLECGGYIEYKPFLTSPDPNTPVLNE